MDIISDKLNLSDCCGLSVTVPTDYSWTNRYDTVIMPSNHYDCKCGNTDGDKKIDDESEEIDLTIDYIIYNDPATIVFWSDGTKTVVKCAPGQKFNKYFGFCAAVTKRIFGTNSLVNRIVESGTDAKPKKSTVKAKKSGKKTMKSRKNAEKELEND